MTSFSTVSTALVPYDPSLPHISIKAHIETIREATRRADNTSRQALEARFLNTYRARHLGGEATLASRMIRPAVAFCPTHTEQETAKRLSDYNKAAKYLSRLTNEQLSSLLDTAKSLGSRTGGELLSLEVEGVPVFIKKIRLTDIEKENPRSTRNLSASFG